MLGWGCGECILLAEAKMFAMLYLHGKESQILGYMTDYL